MWFRRIMFGLLTFWIVVMGLAFGALFVICVSLYLLWHGLSISVIVFGGLFLACIIFTQVALRHVTAKDKRKLISHQPALPLEERDRRLAFTASSGPRDRLKRRKML
jgi:hypothetical protein